jgi:DNA-binding HxlR family transcriptional regulator
MSEQSNVYARNATRAIELLGGKWKLEILYAMRRGPIRLGQLGRLIPMASKKVLAENLRRLEALGLVLRTDLSRQVLHVEYRLAEPIQAETYIVLDRLAQWAELCKEHGCCPEVGQGAEEPPALTMRPSPYRQS